MKHKIMFAVATLLLMSVSGALGAPMHDDVDSPEQTVNRSDRVDYWTCYDYTGVFAGEVDED